MKAGNEVLKLAKTRDYCTSKKPKLTVVMIHGIASNSHSYDQALEYFAEDESLRDVRFVTFDLLGSGESYAGNELNYDYDDQIEALHNSIADLKVGDAPLMLVGHSLGTFIVTRYADTYPGEVVELVLISPPIYTPRDFSDPAFADGVKAFEKTVGAKNPEILMTKAFRNSMDKIVMDENNYAVLAGLKTPVVLIYGDEDQLIASYNVPELLKENSQVTAIKTVGRHSVTRDKYMELAKILERILHA